MKSVKSREPLIHLTKRDRIPVAASIAIRLAAIVVGMLLCGLVAMLLVDKLGNDPSRIGEFYNCFIKGSFSTSRKLWKFLKNTAVLLSISLALTPAFRMRFWNTGAEGQTLVGVLGAIAVNFYCGGKFNSAFVLPEWLLLTLMFFAAIAAGTLWGVIPALFKAKWGTNETLFTLMMNYIATYLVSFFLIIWVPSGSSTLGKLDGGKLPALYNDYLLIIIVVVLLAVLLYIYLNYSKHGYEINVVGESVRTAQYVGIKVKKVIIRTMALSGALCGLAGYLIAAGLDQSITVNSVGGQGFTGIMVAWLAKFNPLLMIVTSAIIIFLSSGTDQVCTSFDASSALSAVVTGIVLFAIIGSDFFINYKVHFRRRTVETEAIK